MIQEVKLKNFQNHEDNSIKFHPGVNTIIGTSDSGKSAIIRALRLVIENKPQGDGYRSWWGGDTEVQITIDNQEITRRRTDSKNEYQLKDMVFKAMGNEIPEEISKLINMDSVNTQFQIDQPFLFSESPGEVARYFNHIAGLDKIDSSLKEVQTRINTVNRKTKHLEEDLGTQMTKLNQFEYLPIFEGKYRILETFVEKKQRIGEKTVLLYNIIEQLKSIEIAKQTLPDTKQAKAKLEVLEEQESELIKLQNNGVSLKNIIKQIKAITGDLKDFNLKLSNKTNVTKLLQEQAKIKQIHKDIVKLADIIEGIGSCNNKSNSMKKELKEMKEEYRKEMPDICPLCNTNLTKN